MANKDDGLVKLDQDNLPALRAALEQTFQLEVGSLNGLIERILEAEDPFDVDAFLGGDLSSLQDNAGRELRILSVRLVPSEKNEQLGVMLIADAIWLDTGEHDQVAIGALTPLVQVTNAVRRNLLPVDVLIEQAKEPTNAGRYPLQLRRLPKNVTAEVVA